MAHEAIELVRQLTKGVMADRVLVTIGLISRDLIPVAMALTRKGGSCVLTARTPLTELMIPLLLVNMVTSSKQLEGALFRRNESSGEHADVSVGLAEDR